jgi:hypothetical protein
VAGYTAQVAQAQQAELRRHQKRTVSVSTLMRREILLPTLQIDMASAAPIRANE